MSSRRRWVTSPDGPPVHQPGLPRGVWLPDLPGALCAQVDPELWFPDKGDPAEKAKAICRRCPEQAACLAWALEAGEAHGVWGGLAPEERAALAQARRAA